MKILFITATRIGDAILSTGVLQHLLERHPGARVTVVCGPDAASLFEAVPGLDRVLVMRKKRWSMHWVHMWKTCVGSFWDCIVDIRNAPVSYLLANKQNWHLGQSNLSDHKVVRLAAMMGLKDSPPCPRLWYTDQQSKKAEQVISSGGPVIAIAPVANWKPKTWAARNFVDLIGRLTKKQGILPGARVLVFGAESERDQAAELLSGIAMDQMVDCMGKLSLLEVYATMEKADLFIGNDSGLMHMAAAAGIPTLGLFGPSREEQYAPWGHKSMSVRGHLAYEEIFPPDYDHRNTDGLDLMASLSVDRVEQAATELWQRVNQRDNP
jgi:ADP-heptose:LPS heptosyltransferase